MRSRSVHRLLSRLALLAVLVLVLLPAAGRLVNAAMEPDGVWTQRCPMAGCSSYAGRIDGYILLTCGPGGAMRAMSPVAGVAADIGGGELGIGPRPATHWTLAGSLAYAWGEQRDSGAARNATA